MKVKTQREIHEDYVAIYDGFLRKTKADKRQLEKQKADCKDYEQYIVKILDAEIAKIEKEIKKYENAIAYHKEQLK